MLFADMVTGGDDSVVAGVGRSAAWQGLFQGGCQAVGSLCPCSVLSALCTMSCMCRLLGMCSVGVLGVKFSLWRISDAHAPLSSDVGDIGVGAGDMRGIVQEWAWLVGVSAI
jgi:hypothetical protein